VIWGFSVLRLVVKIATKVGMKCDVCLGRDELNKGGVAETKVGRRFRQESPPGWPLRAFELNGKGQVQCERARRGG